MSKEKKVGAFLKQLEPSHSESRNKLTRILKNIEWIPRLRNSDLYVSNAKEKVCECNGFP